MCVDLLRNILHLFMIFNDSEAASGEEMIIILPRTLLELFVRSRFIRKSKLIN